MEENLTAVLQLKDQMTPGLEKATAATKTLGATFASVGASVARIGIVIKASFLMMAKSALSAADQYDKMAKQTGINVKNIQRMSIAAQAAGASMHQVVAGLKILSSHAYAASMGSKEAAKKFTDLGIAIYDSSGKLKGGEELLGNFADVIKNTTNPTERLALATRTLGRAGAELIPYLSQGSEKLKQMGRDAESMGFIMSETTVEALDTFGDQLGTLKTIFVNMLGNWLAQTGITVPKIIDAFLGFSKSLIGFKNDTILIFRNIVNLGEYLYKGLKIWFDALVEAGKIAFAKLAGSVEPLVEAFNFVLVSIGAMSQQTADKISSAMVQLGEAAKDKSVLDPFKAALGKTLDAYDELDAKRKASKKLSDELKESEKKDIDDFGQKLKDQIIVDTKGGTGSTAADDAANEARARRQKEEELTFIGGLKAAIVELTEATINYKERWGEVFNTMKDGFSDAVAGMIAEGRSLNDSLKVLFKNIKYQFIRMITDMVMNAVFKQFASTLMSIIPGIGGAMGGGGTAAPGMNASRGVGGNAGGGGGGGSSGFTAPGTSGATVVPQGGIGANWGITSNTGNALMGAGIAVGGAAGGYVMQRGVEKANPAMSAAGGALAGAAMGAVFGPVGMVVGAIAGAALGYFQGNEAKKEEEKMKERAREQEEEARRQHEAMVEKAKGLIKMHVRNNMGGGLATEEAMKDVSGLLSGDISAEEVEKFGAENVVARQAEIERQANVDVGGISVSVNATVSGGYDVQRLAEDLGYYLSGSIKSAAAGAAS